MAEIQDVKYKILVVRTDSSVNSLERYFEGGDVDNKVNGVPTADFTFNNKNLTLSNGILSGTDSTYIVLSVSKEPDVWERAFNGYVEDRTKTLDSDGKRTIRLTAYDAPELRYSFISANQLGIGFCDFGQLFTGSPTTSHGTTWASDSYGNYPNGLLYDTHYTYAPDSIIHYMYGMDLPLRVSYNTNKKLDAIKSWLEPFQAVFAIDTRQRLFGVYSSSLLRAYPTGDKTFSVGTDIQQMTEVDDLSPVSNKVTVVGTNKSIHYTYGSGSIHDLILNGEFSSMNTARNIAVEYLSRSSIRTTSYDFVVRPENVNYVGKSVVINEKYIPGTNPLDSRLLGTASVDEMRHTFAPDRWDTKISANRVNKTDAETVAAIKSSIETLKTSMKDYNGVAYVRAISGDTIFSINEGVNCDNIVAIGFGTTSDITTESGLDGPLIIKRVSNVLTTSMWEFLNGHATAYAVLNPGEGNGHIKNIALFANHGAKNTPKTISENRTWTRPFTEWNATFTSSFMYPILTTSNKFLLSVDDVKIISAYDNCIVYPYKANQASNFMLLNNQAGTVPTPATLSVDGSSTWAENGFLISNVDKDKLSWDAKMLTPTFSTVVFRNMDKSGACSKMPVQIMVEWTLPVNPAGKAREIAKRILLYMTALCSYSSLEHNDEGTLSVWAWKSASDGTWNWEWREQNVPAGNLDNIYTTIVPADGLGSYIDDSGKFRYMIYAQMPTDYPNATLSVRLGYLTSLVDVVNETDSGLPLEESFFERCEVDPVTGNFKTKNTPTTLLGMYASATDDDDGGFTEITDAYNMLSNDTVVSTNLSIFKNDYGKIPRKWWWNLVPEDARYGTDGWNFITHEEYIADWLYKNEWLNPIDDENMRAAFDTVVSKHAIYVKYVTKRDTWEVPPAETTFAINANNISTSFVPGTYASKSVLYINHASLPPYYCNLKFNMSFVASATSDSGGVIGKCVFDTESTVREGIDKNAYKALYVQYDWLGSFLEYTQYEGVVSDEGGGFIPISHITWLIEHAWE